LNLGEEKVGLRVGMGFGMQQRVYIHCHKVNIVMNGNLYYTPASIGKSSKLKQSVNVYDAMRRGGNPN